jgi:hypothetical protein
MNETLDENALRKAWLKKKFASWEYHEELLKLHQDYLTSLRRHWDRPDIQQAYPEDFKSMQTPVFTNLDRVQRPGEITRSEWSKKPTVGWADSIAYNFNRGMDFAGCNEYAGMADAERQRLNRLVGEMLTHCTNIRITVEGRWDDSDDEILNERYTGLVEWPNDWRQDLLGLSAPFSNDSSPRVKGGEPAPEGGTWQALDPSGRRLRVQAGDILPDLRSAYGTTLWRRIGD